MVQKTGKIKSSSHLKIVAIGGECTGKTTLVSQLSKFFGAPHSIEAARDYVSEIGRSVQYEDVEIIAKKQILIEDNVALLDSDLVFFDTDLFSTLVYSNFYFGDCPDWIEQLCVARRAHIYLLCSFDLTWVKDEFQRGSGAPEKRRQIHALFDKTLHKHGCNVVEISGTGQARLNQAITAIKKIVGQSHLMVDQNQKSS